MIQKEISEALQKGDVALITELVEKALSDGVPVQSVLNDGLLDGMGVIGSKWKNNQIFVPEVLVAARAMNKGMEILKPLLHEAGVESDRRVCLGTVKGDLHDIGKNLVKMMMEGRGLKVIDIGIDAPPEKFVNTAIEQDCKIIACSSLLTSTMAEIKHVIEAAQAAGIRDKVKIMIGGAPVNQAFCDQVGADIYTADAASAADVAVSIFEA